MSASSPGRSAEVPTSASQYAYTENSKDLILRSFVPHVAIYASQDTEELARRKGIRAGFKELLRPFGDSIHGKVVIRDSAGASRSWDNYGVRFVALGDGTESSAASDVNAAEANDAPSDRVYNEGCPYLDPTRTGGDIGQIEDLVNGYISLAETQPDVRFSGHGNQNGSSPGPSSSMSPFYALYLQRLLSGLPVTPHETFSHPVACIIAISSRNPAPIEALRQLYSSSSQGNGRLPRWVSNEFLRYYVLVHDEDRDDITKSTALFDQMKRHFGLHCHLLRLRSSDCVPSDDDSVRLPQAAWISAAEELARLREREVGEDTEDLELCIFESDVSAIKTFVREMVTQSVVPFMESRVTAWNDQVASRRRGLSGRFISLSKRWTGFGSSNRSTSASGLSGPTNPSGSSYDSLNGFYGPDTAEATMRKLADYSFMLRDWKLAQSTYELLRTDFSSDKAWMYHAGANEMAALSTLLAPQAMTPRVRLESIDQMLETASYSYRTRCSASYAALRCLALSVELLKLRGGSAADDAARWATRIIDLSIVGPSGHGLFTERVAACYRSRVGAGSVGWGSRRRKSAFWSVLASDIWLGLGKIKQAEHCVNDAERLYDSLRYRSDGLGFSEMQGFLHDLQHHLKANLSAARGQTEISDITEDDVTLIEEHSERLGQRDHRKSLIGTGSLPFHLADKSPQRAINYSPGVVDDRFE